MKYKVGEKLYSDKTIYSKAKRMNKSIYGTQQAVSYLAQKYKVRWYNPKTKRWNVVPKMYGR